MRHKLDILFFDSNLKTIELSITNRLYMYLFSKELEIMLFTKELANDPYDTESMHNLYTNKDN